MEVTAGWKIFRTEEFPNFTLCKILLGRSNQEDEMGGE
jgi:hypothetical protein